MGKLVVCHYKFIVTLVLLLFCVSCDPPPQDQEKNSSSAAPTNQVSQDSTSPSVGNSEETEETVEDEIPAPELPAMSEEEMFAFISEFFQPLKEQSNAKHSAVSQAKIALGKRLFHDQRVSKEGTLSCSSCHNLNSYGVDNRSHSFNQVVRNTPSILNVSLNQRLGWDGYLSDLQTSNEQPFFKAGEMGYDSHEELLAKIKQLDYAEAFQQAYPTVSQAITLNHIKESLSAFEKTLLTSSRFDRFLAGDKTQLTKQEKQGLFKFVAYGCAGCHEGVGVGGNKTEKMGIMEPYKNSKDLGLFAVTKKEEDKYVFKVPSLRNVTRTYPYFHDGEVQNISQAVQLMAQLQLGFSLSPQDVADIVVFLDTLTGDLPQAS